MKRYCLLVVFAIAAPAQTTLTLREAVARALETHPLMEAGEHRIAVSEGVKRQASLAPNPRFAFQTENVRFSGNPAFQYWSDTDTFASLQYTFETSDKRKRRVDAASAGLRRTALGRELLAKRIAGRVKRAYWSAAGAQRACELLMEAAKNFLLTVEYHELRVREGAMAEADLLRVRLESEGLALAANTAFLEAERARINLFREMGQPDVPDTLTYDRLEAPEEAPVDADAQLALNQRTEMKLARVAVEQARANLRLEEANARPNLDGVLGYKRTTGWNTLVAGVQFDLPFRNRNQGSIAAASAGTAVARSELASTAALVRAEVAAAGKNYDIRRRQVTELLRPMLEHATESSNIAQAAYREGGLDLLRLLDAERLRIETQLLYYRALSEHRQGIAALETAMGVTP